MESQKPTRMQRLRVAAVAALPGLGIVAASVAVTTWLTTGWAIPHHARTEAVLLAPYFGMPLLVVGVYVIIQRVGEAIGNRKTK